MVERWAAVKGYEGYYEVSTEGRVRSLDRTVEQRANGGKMMSRFAPGRVLKGGTGRKGYLQVTLCLDGSTAVRPVHQLVLEAFVGSRPNGFVADHIDGNHLNNTPDNLRWVSYRANAINRHSPRGNNTHVGVDYRSARRKPWRAKSTTMQGRSQHIGYFATEAEAVAAYQAFKAAQFSG